MSSAHDGGPLLNVKGLKTYFFTEAGVVKALDDINFKIGKGESVGLVGESGSGKTVTALSVMRIVPTPGKILEGEVEFDGEDLLTKREEEMRKVRGPKISMIFQDPTSSLNPVLNIETQLVDILLEHTDITKAQAKDEAAKLLEVVGLPEAEKRIADFPHQFSGGMKQRIAIARALALKPQLLFADEPTTSLDVTIQAQVLELLRGLRKEFGMSLVMITHDMGIIADLTERVVVLYAGRVAEVSTTRDLYRNPKHPYTEALLSAVPRLDKRKVLEVIPGNIPNLIEAPTGCRFHPRCRYATQICMGKVPPLEDTGEGHLVSCHHWKELTLKGEE
ncbi:MAG: ABC transporter ATP-binding protein [Nitrososphaerales archaeon]|nr:ABC transporter ATP-binding protein [Nitrososphaerales archaeon]